MSNDTMLELIQKDEFVNELKSSLPEWLTVDRFTSIARSAIINCPNIAKCTPKSVFQSLLKLARFGLEPDGWRAHLIPFRDNKTGVYECTLIIDWKGYADLLHRSKLFKVFYTGLVLPGDKFDHQRGSDAFLIHKEIDTDRDDSKVIQVYSFFEFENGGIDFEIMTRAQVERVRKCSKTAFSGPWVKWWGEQARKTVLKRHAKRLSLSPELKEQLYIEDDFDPEREPDREVAKPIGGIADAFASMKIAEPIEETEEI